MSNIISLLHTVDICCPYCDEYNEVDDLEISVTVDNTDVSRPKDECCFEYKCEHCGKEFEVRPQLHVDVIAL